MSDRRVRFTLTAANHIESEQAWWKENRDYQEVFATEVEQALRLVALLPGSGTLCPQTPVDLWHGTKVVPKQFILQLLYSVGPEPEADSGWSKQDHASRNSFRSRGWMPGILGSWNGFPKRTASSYRARSDEGVENVCDHDSQAGR